MEEEPGNSGSAEASIGHSPCAGEGIAVLCVCTLIDRLIYSCCCRASIEATCFCNCSSSYILSGCTHTCQSGTVWCCLQNKNVLLDDPDRHHGGVPCEHFSLLLGKGQKKHATCVRDATGVSGRGYKHEREYVVKMKIPLTVEEQAPYECLSCCVCVSRAALCVCLHLSLSTCCWTCRNLLVEAYT